MSAADIAGRPAGRTAGRLQTVAVIVITAVVIGLAAFLIGGGTSNAGVTEVDLGAGAAVNAPTIGSVPPAFTGTTYSGESVDFGTYLAAGKPTWLTFGASWCPDCRNEALDVEAAYQANQDKVQLLAVFINEPGSDVEGYAQRAGLTFPIVVDQPGAIADAYRTMGIPTHFFIGADGTVREVRIGALSRDEMDRAIAAIQN